MTARDVSYIEHIGDKGGDVSALPTEAQCQGCGNKPVWEFNLRVDYRRAGDGGKHTVRVPSWCRHCENARKRVSGIDRGLWDALTKVAQARGVDPVSLAEVAIRAWLERQWKKAREQEMLRKARQMAAIASLRTKVPHAGSKDGDVRN